MTKGAKRAMRVQMLERRASRTPAERAAAAAALTRVVLGVPAIRDARTVAAYWPFGDEPSPTAALAVLSETGVTVLLPVGRPDGDLDWAPYTGIAGLVPGRWRFDEPDAPPAGVAAIASVDAILVPALAVDRTGGRLGRGSGSYDRALVRVPLSTPVFAIVYDDEVVDGVPTEEHDRRVTGILTPGGVVQLSGP
ncbi:MAG: 5-formyltetrahydrofolate cyclo-ligase [Frankiales bacterium]|nr:5-formyltetrahydrofolate cyclo-ligase [Frankiales bacterium]